VANDRNWSRTVVIDGLFSFNQGCGSVSGSGLDPDSIGSVDPDPDSESGSRRANSVTDVNQRYFSREYLIIYEEPGFRHVWFGSTKPEP
jgi:hypothetical protein